jgi:hypothetical protein
VSRTTVRHAVGDWLQGGVSAIPGLQQVYRALPVLRYGELGSGIWSDGSSAFAWVHLAESRENQWSYPAGPGLGVVGVHYDVVLMVACQYLTPSAQDDPTAEQDAWADWVDATIQGLKDRVHADPSLGNRGVILAAGREPDALKTSSEEPLLIDGGVLSMHTIEFRVTEQGQL